jgi:TonB family protein
MSIQRNFHFVFYALFCILLVASTVSRFVMTIPINKYTKSTPKESQMKKFVAMFCMTIFMIGMLSSCPTTLKGMDSTVRFNSNPSLLPLTVEMQRGENFVVGTGSNYQQDSIRLDTTRHQYAHQVFDITSTSTGLIAQDSIIINRPFNPLKVDKEPPVDLRAINLKIIYPEPAKRADIQGKVVIRALIDRNGICVKCFVEYTDSDLLVDSTLHGVKNTKLQPAIKDGKPIPYWVSIPIIYRLR